MKIITRQGYPIKYLNHNQLIPNLTLNNPFQPSKAQPTQLHPPLPLKKSSTPSLSKLKTKNGRAHTLHRHSLSASPCSDDLPRHLQDKIQKSPNPYYQGRAPIRGLPKGLSSSNNPDPGAQQPDALRVPRDNDLHIFNLQPSVHVVPIGPDSPCTGRLIPALAPHAHPARLCALPSKQVLITNPIRQRAG